MEDLVQNNRKSLVCLSTLLAGLVCFSDTARAQNGTISVNPPQLTFSGPTGTTPAPQMLNVTSSAGAAGVTVAAFTSDGGWLTVTPTNGTTPLQLTVSVNPALITVAKDIGFINISSEGVLQQSVEVEYDNTGGSQTPSAITANPNSLSFNFPANSSVPLTKDVSLTAANNSTTTFTARATTNNGGNWLTLNPTSGSLPASLEVTVNPAELSGSGPFSAAIAITPPGTAGTTVQVLVTLGGTPAIQFSPGQLNFAWQVGTTAPVAQTLSISSSTGAAVGFTTLASTTSCGNWLVISPESGATPGSITAQINTSGLSGNQTCSGQIAIAAPGASNPNVDIPVTLLVSSNPLLLVPSSGPTFTYQLGTSTEPAAQNVQITSSSTALTFTASAAPTTAGGPSFITLAPLTGTTPQQLALTVNPLVLATLAPGNYGETVTVTSAGAGNSPQTFPVTLTVNNNPLLNTSASSLTFNYEVGQATPPSQTFTVSSTSSPLNFQTSVTTNNCSGFLSATATGNPVLTYGNQNQVVVSVNTTGLTTDQVCTGQLTLSVPNSSTPAVNIPVKLDVSKTALLNVSTQAINVTMSAGAAATTQTVAVTSTDSTVFTFAAAAATNPIGLTWLSVAPNTGNTPSNLLVTISPANLGVGTYDGTITVSGPNVPSQVIHVQLIIVASNVSAAPASVTLMQPLGGAAVSQTVQISGVPSGTTIGALATTLSASGWLTASASGNTVTITANGTGLSLGSYGGIVTVIAPGTGGSPLYIPVTLDVTAAVALSVSSTSVPFAYTLNGSLPAPQTVQVSSTTAGLPFAATFTASGAFPVNENSNFVTVTPTSGTTPGDITLSLDQAAAQTLTPGNYTGTVAVTSTALPGQTANITVNLTVSAATGPGVTAIVSAASFIGGSVSPGEIISIFGTNLGPTPGLNFTHDNGHVDTALGATTVMFGTVAAPILYVSATQINAIVPYSVLNPNSNITGGSIPITVINDGAFSTAFTVAVTNTAPGIFSANQSGNGQGAILNSNLSANSDNNPAPKGSIISIYATGEGAITPATTTGTIFGPSLPLPAPIASVSVTIGGQPAMVSYAGEAPTLVDGVLQVNVTVPMNIPSGNQLVVLTIGGATNTRQSITVAVE